MTANRGVHVGASTLTMLAALVAFAPFAIDTVLPALPSAMAEFGAGSGSFRLVSSATFIGLGLGQAVGGPLSDRIGRRAPALGSAWAFGLAAAACALAPSLLMLQAASLLAGVSAAVGIVSSRAAIRDIATDDQAAHLLARVWSIGGFAPVAMPLIGAGVLQLGGWRAIYWVLAAYAVILAVALHRRFPETHEDDARHTGTHGDTLRIGLALLRDRRFLSYVGILTGAMVTFIGYVSAAPFIFQRLHGWSAVQFSLIYSFNGLVSVFMARWMTRHIVRIGAHRLLVIGLRSSAIAGLVVLAGGAVDNVWVVAAGFTLLLATWSLTMNNAIALGMSSQSVASGTASAVLGLGSYAAGGVVTAVVGAAGGVGPMTTGLIMLGGIAIATLFLTVVHTHTISEELSA